VLVGVGSAPAMATVAVRVTLVGRRAPNVRSGRSIMRKALAVAGLMLCDPWVDTAVDEAFVTSYT